MNRLIQIVIVSTVAIFLNACITESDDTNSTQVPPADSVSSSSVVPTSPGVVYYVSGDFGGAGEIRSIDLADNSLSGNLGSIDQDARIFSQGTNVYVLERGVGNIVKYNHSTQSVVYQNKLAAGSNPYDLVFMNDSVGFVAYYGLPYVVKMNLKTGVALDSIDLSQYSLEGESTPNASDLELSGEKLYVSMQRFNSSWAPDTAKIAVINTTTNTIESTIILPAKNPSNSVVVGASLYAACSGEYGEGDGAIVKVDLATATSTIVLDNATLVGNPASMGTSMIHKSGSLFYVAIDKGWPNTAVSLVDLSSATLVKTIDSTVAVGGGLFYNEQRDLLVLGEQKDALSGVTVYTGDALIAGPLGSTINSPNSITVVFE